MCFSKSERSRVNQENPGQTTQAIASLLGEEWRALSEKEKQVIAIIYMLYFGYNYY